MQIWHQKGAHWVNIGGASSHSCFLYLLGLLSSTIASLTSSALSNIWTSLPDTLYASPTSCAVVFFNKLKSTLRSWKIITETHEIVELLEPASSCYVQWVPSLWFYETRMLHSWLVIWPTHDASWRRMVQQECSWRSAHASWVLMIHVEQDEPWELMVEWGLQDRIP